MLASQYLEKKGKESVGEKEGKNRNAKKRKKTGKPI